MLHLAFIFLCFIVGVNSGKSSIFSNTFVQKLILGEIDAQSKPLAHAAGTEIESTDELGSGTTSNIDGRFLNEIEGSGIEGSGFYSNKTGRWWWWSNDEEEEEEDDADDSTWTEWAISGIVENTLELGMEVVSGAASGVANYVSEGLFGDDDDDQPTTQKPATTEGSWLLGGIISNILNGRKLHQSYDINRINRTILIQDS